ncbi:hypothetical protein SAMN06264346_12510 [Chryseobacterium profundimaris]|uniref:Uncharacterized protein n=1 Tax=Chryseobacterium profundimaris TaxID=1387275 RepID=A0ABY1PKH6_9FLAO|nr:hypothetical protein SAMN06264346_12510 [Chryseobacterium profundimaris]
MVYSRYNTILFTKILHFFCDLNLIDGWIIFQLFKKNPSEFFPVAQKAAIIRQTFGCFRKDVTRVAKIFGCSKSSNPEIIPINTLPSYRNFWYNSTNFQFFTLFLHCFETYSQQDHHLSFGNSHQILPMVYLAAASEKLQV